MTMALGLPEPKTFAQSIFARKTLPGRIFVEASAERAATIARIMPDLYQTKLRLVPPAWMTKLLKLASQPPIQPQTWVRLRKPPKKYKIYQEDIAFVVKVERSRMIQICLAPRSGEMEPGGLRPKQRLIVNEELEMLDKTDRTDQGYVLIDGPVDMVTYGTHVWPTADELRFFLACTLLNDGLRGRSESMIVRQALRLRDRVKVTSGSLLGLTGIIEDLSERTADVRIESLDIKETLLRTEIRTYFRPGDQVRVTNGAWKDIVGWVTAVEDHRATVHREDKYQEVCLYFCSVLELSCPVLC